MSAIDRIAFYQNRRDEVPNQELARDLAAQQERTAIQEIAEGLWDRNPNVQSDCLKVLYEIGYLDPTLIAGYMDDFLRLLKNRNNRMVWGGMIALSTIAALKADDLYPHVAEIEAVIEEGSVITKDSGIKTLADIASQNDVYRAHIFPSLLRCLETCRPKDAPRYAEVIASAVNAGYQADFIRIVEKRMSDVADSGATRLKKVLKDVHRRSAFNQGNKSDS